MEYGKHNSEVSNEMEGGDQEPKTSNIFGLKNQSQETPTSKIIEIQVPSYHPGRFQKPWISKILEWATGSLFKVEWGKFYYTSYRKKEAEGFLEISARPGDLIRWGQRPQNGPEYLGYRHFELVNEDGSLQRLSIKEARAYWRTKHGT